MKEITANYSDLIRQHIRCEGIIRNTSQGLIIELKTKDYVTKEDFLINFLNKFQEPYCIHADEYNQKEYKRYLAEQIKEAETRLEKLKFAHKICGRKIL